MTFEEWWDSLGSEWYGKHAPAGKGIAQTAWQASRKEALRHALPYIGHKKGCRAVNWVNVRQDCNCGVDHLTREAEGKP